MENKIPIPKGIRSAAYILIIFGVLNFVGFTLSLIALYQYNYILKPEFDNFLNYPFGENITAPEDFKKEFSDIRSFLFYDFFFIESAIKSGILFILLLIPGITLLKRRLWPRIWAIIVLGILVLMSSLSGIISILSFNFLEVITGLFSMLLAGLFIWQIFLLLNKESEEYFLFLKKMNSKT